MSRLVIFGAGGHARELADVADAMRDDGADLQLLGLLDDDAALHGLTIRDLPVLGGLDWLQHNAADDLQIVIGIGSPVAKQRVAQRLAPVQPRYATLVHPHAVLTRFVDLAPGVVITAGCVLTNTITLGEHVHVNRCATVSHDCLVGPFTHLSPGVVLSGNVRIGTGCDIGTNACVLPGKSVGDGSIVGAGAVVRHDVPARSTAVGVPARVIKSASS